jgi:hypothetical protein
MRTIVQGIAAVVRPLKTVMDRVKAWLLASWYLVTSPVNTVVGLLEGCSVTFVKGGLRLV